jgi:tetratricopeptide (TPR) repeat protein
MRRVSARATAAGLLSFRSTHGVGLLLVAQKHNYRGATAGRQEVFLTRSSRGATDLVRIFVSHAHTDAPLARSLQDLITTVFDEVEVDYSSDVSAGGGIEAGTDWLQWILDKLRSCDMAVVVLTPESLSRPWLMWESGAVNGIALALEQQPQIVPLLFRVNRENVAGPLSRLQAELGETEEGVRRVAQAVWRHRGHKPAADILELRLTVALKTYLDGIREALADRPQSLDEGGVQEWCDRLDALRRAGRHAEVMHVHRALLLAVGREAGDERSVPLDVRLHRRLGELYLDAKRGRDAAVQFELSLRLFPRDIFLLHKLALAQLQDGDRGQSLATLNNIEAIDPSAAGENPEIAGLKGRLYRERWQVTSDETDLRTARDAYQAALEHLTDSYYIAGNAGELSLALGDREAAEAAYETAVAVIRRSGERTWWSLATLAGAAIVRGDEAEALSLLGEAGALGPSPRDIESIRLGLQRLQTYLGLSADVAAGWFGALAGGRPVTADAVQAEKRLPVQRGEIVSAE